jgi:hypothetical protein
MKSEIGNEPSLEDFHFSVHLDAALAHLSTQDRNALVLRYLQQKSVKETAECLRITDHAAKKRITRALGKLRRLFAGRGLIVPAVSVISLMTALPTMAAPLPLKAALINTPLLAQSAAGTSSHVIAKGVARMLLRSKLRAAALAACVGVVAAVSFLAIPRGIAQTALPEAKPRVATVTPVTSTAPNDGRALALLDQSEKSVARMGNAEFSYSSLTKIIGATEKGVPEAFLRAGHIRREEDKRWLVIFTDWQGTLSTPTDQRHSQNMAVSFAEDLLVLERNRPTAKGRTADSLNIWPKNVLRVWATQLFGMALDGYLLEDQSQEVESVAVPLSFFDIMRRSALTAKSATDAGLVTLTAAGPYGQYILTIDPAAENLPNRLEVTKTGDDLYVGDKLSELAKPFLPGPHLPLKSFHLLLDQIHFLVVSGHSVIDSARLTEEFPSTDGTLVTFKSELRRTDIHLSPQWKASDFDLDVPDGTPVGIVSNRNQPIKAKKVPLEYRDGKVVRVSDGQPASDEDKLP